MVSMYAGRDGDGEGTGGGETWQKLKSVMNLTTKVTSMCIHPTGDIMAIGSNEVCGRGGGGGGGLLL